MGATRSVACLSLTLMALALTGCFSDDGDDGAREAARDFSLAVERITNGIDGQTADALTDLNKAATGSLEPRTASRRLDRRASAIRSAKLRLRRLDAPAKAELTLGTLASMVGDLSRNLAISATDIRVARRDRGDVHAAVVGAARLIGVGSSGVSTLSGALRALVDALAHNR